MSTVATTRATLTQNALSTPATPTLSPVICVNSSASLSPRTSPLNGLTPHAHTRPPILDQLCALRRRRIDMHPDCMLLQAHGVTSPRLSPSASVLAGEKYGRHSDTMSREASALDEVDMCESIDSADEMDVVGDDEGVAKGPVEQMRIREISELEAKTAAARLADAAAIRCEEEVDTEADVEEEDDALSLCSEDSELSVGQEGGSANAAACQTTPSFCDFNQQRRLLLSNVGNMMALCAPSAFSSVHAPASACGDGSDARSSASTDDNTMQQLDEESVGSGTSSALQQHVPLQAQPAPSALLDPYVVASALRMPVPVLPRATNHTASFQTEFMRKSHMYAEELMKQQMQLMAAARASAFTLRGAGVADTLTPDRRAFTRIPGAPQPMSNFAGIQSQLTAFTKMSQLSAAAAAAAVAVAAVANNNQATQQQNKTNIPNSTDTLNKLSALTTAHTQLSPTTASAVSSLSQLQAQMQAHFPYAHANHTNDNLNNNNNLNEPALKFSIDNILKADFGRRLAEGAACMAACNNVARAAKGITTHSNSSATQRARKAANTLTAVSSTVAGATSSSTAIDLTHLSAATSTATTTAASSATLNFSHTLANICTNSSDSNSTAVSSSFGAASEHAKSPANGELSAASAKCTSAEFGTKAAEEANSSGSAVKSSGTGASGSGPIVWPAWVYCTRYSDRPSSGPRTRKPKKLAGEKGSSSGASNGSGSGGGGAATAEDKRPRTAFSGSQLARLKHEFTENRYLTEKRRQQLSSELGLNEAQIKIWFQNKRAKLKKSSGTKNPLALQLMAQGLYNHSTVPLTREEEELQELQERENAAAAAAAAEQEEARERREMFSRKLQKARARYELLHPNESDTDDDDSYENETDSKRFCAENPHNNNNLSEKQDQPEAEPTDGLNVQPTEIIEIESDDDTDDGCAEQAKATKSLIIKKIWSQRGSETDLVSPVKKSTSNGGRNVKSANKYVISPGDDDGIKISERKVEIVDLCTPPKAKDSSVAEYQSTPTTSRKRFRKRRLNFTM